MDIDSDSSRKRSHTDFEDDICCGVQDAAEAIAARAIAIPKARIPFQSEESLINIRRILKYHELITKRGSDNYWCEVYRQEKKTKHLDEAAKILSTLDRDFEGYHYHNTMGYSLNIILNDTRDRIKMKHCLSTANIDSYTSLNHIHSVVKNGFFWPHHRLRQWVNASPESRLELNNHTKEMELANNRALEKNLLLYNELANQLGFQLAHNKNITMEELQDKAVAWTRMMDSDIYKLKAFSECADNFLFFSKQDPNTDELKSLLNYIIWYNVDYKVSKLMFSWDYGIRDKILNYDNMPTLGPILDWDTARSFADSQNIWKNKFNGGSPILKEIERRKIRWENESERIKLYMNSR
jgi:DNA primase